MQNTSLFREQLIFLPFNILIFTSGARLANVSTPCWISQGLQHIIQ